MSLSGQLNDLSLAELIEFFCNQRKSGRLKVSYPRAPGFFYFEKGSLIDAKIGALHGVEAVYYSLTLENASFKFSTAFEPTRRTIHQPWTHVALEGLRRMDEGIAPGEAFPDNNNIAYLEDAEGASVVDAVEEEISGLAQASHTTQVQPVFVKQKVEASPPPAAKAPAAWESVNSPLSLTVEKASGGSRRVMVYATIAGAILICVAAIGVPAGWYSKNKASAAAAPATSAQTTTAETANAQSGDAGAPPLSQTDVTGAATIPDTDPGPVNNTAAILAAKREREARERLKTAEERASEGNVSPNAPVNPEAAKKPEAAKPAPRTMTVQVTYDEAGRVTQASGGDANATRIARQKRFPPGKGGTATVTIPVN